MTVQLLTPWAAAIALVAVVPLVAWVVAERRAANVRHAIGLEAPDRRRSYVVPGAAMLAVALLALAAAQPVVASHHAAASRRAADVFVVIDTSRSMLAAPAPGKPTRFSRATEIAAGLRDATPSAAFGIASLTDRVLPHLFPTGDRADFLLTLQNAVGIQKPPPTENVRGSGTNLGALGDLGTARFFEQGSPARIAVVLTDGESRRFAVDRTAAALKRARISLVLIRLGSTDERVWTPAGKPESYRPLRGAGVELARTAAALGGAAYGEAELPAATAAVEGLLGPQTELAGLDVASVRQLAPFLAVAALLPVCFVLWRRNLR